MVEEAKTAETELSTSSRGGDAVRPGLPLALFHHQRRKDGGRGSRTPTSSSSRRNSPRSSCCRFSRPGSRPPSRCSSSPRTLSEEGIVRVAARPCCAPGPRSASSRTIILTSRPASTLCSGRSRCRRVAILLGLRQSTGPPIPFSRPGEGDPDLSKPFTRRQSPCSPRAPPPRSAPHTSGSRSRAA